MLSASLNKTFLSLHGRVSTPFSVLLLIFCKHYIDGPAKPIFTVGYPVIGLRIKVKDVVPGDTRGFRNVQ